MGRKNANGEGSIVDLWKKYGDKKHKHYQCRIMCRELDDTGKRHYVYANANTVNQARLLCKKKAEKYDYQQKQKLNSVLLTADITEKDTFGSSANLFMSYIIKDRQWSDYTAKTRTNEMNSVINRIGNYKIKDLTTDKLKLLFIDLLDNYTRQGVGSRYFLLYYYFEYLIDTAVISSNPMRGVKLPKRKKSESLKLEQIKAGKVLQKNTDKIFTEEEISRLLYYADDYKRVSDSSPSNYRGRRYFEAYRIIIFAVMYLTGLRGQEMRALTVNDVDFKNKTLTVNKALSIGTKDGKSAIVLKETKTQSGNRVIKINQQALDYLEWLITNKPNSESPFLVCTKKGDWISKDYFADIFDKVLVLCGIEKRGRSPHELRHTFISFCIEKNSLAPLTDAPPLLVSAYVGHSTLDFTLQVYTHISGNKLQDIPDLKIVDPFSYID